MKQHSNLGWEIGNGESVYFWLDKWLEGGQRLADMRTDPVTVEESNLRVKDMVRDDGDMWGY